MFWEQIRSWLEWDFKGERKTCSTALIVWSHLKHQIKGSNISLSRRWPLWPLFRGRRCFQENNPPPFPPPQRQHHLPGHSASSHSSSVRSAHFSGYLKCQDIYSAYVWWIWNSIPLLQTYIIHPGMYTVPARLTSVNTQAKLLRCPGVGRLHRHQDADAPAATFRSRKSQAATWFPAEPKLPSTLIFPNGSRIQ